jgi:hypothetical protein
MSNSKIIYWFEDIHICECCVMCGLFVNNVLYNIWCENAHATSFLWLFKKCFIFLELRICLYILSKHWPYRSAYFLYYESMIHHAIPTQKRTNQNTCYIICLMVNPQFLDCMNIPMTRNDNN